MLLCAVRDSARRAKLGCGAPLWGLAYNTSRFYDVPDWTGLHAARASLQSQRDRLRLFVAALPQSTFQNQLSSNNRAATALSCETPQTRLTRSTRDR